MCVCLCVCLCVCMDEVHVIHLVGYSGIYQRFTKLPLLSHLVSYFSDKILLVFTTIITRQICSRVFEYVPATFILMTLLVSEQYDLHVCNKVVIELSGCSELITMVMIVSIGSEIRVPIGCEILWNISSQMEIKPKIMKLCLLL